MGARNCGSFPAVVKSSRVCLADKFKFHVFGGVLYRSCEVLFFVRGLSSRAAAAMQY